MSRVLIVEDEEAIAIRIAVKINTNFNRWRESYILFISKYSVNIY